MERSPIEDNRTLENHNGNNGKGHGSSRSADDLYQQLMKEIQQENGDREFCQNKQPEQNIKTVGIEQVKANVQNRNHTFQPVANDFALSEIQERSSGGREINSRDNGQGEREREKTIEQLFRAENRTNDMPSAPSRRMPTNKVAPLSRIQPNDDTVKQSKSRGKSKIKCAKNYRQIAAEKAMKGVRGAANMAKTVVKEVLPEPLQGIMGEPQEEPSMSDSTPKKQREQSGTRTPDIVSTEPTTTVGEKKSTTKKKCKIKTSKTYKQIIAEKSKKVAKFAAKKAHATAMQYAGAYVPQPMMKKLNNKLADHGFISPAYSRMSTESPYSPHYSPKRRPYSGVKKKSKIKSVRRKEGKVKKEDDDDDVWSDEELEVEDMGDDDDDDDDTVNNSRFEKKDEGEEQDRKDEVVVVRRDVKEENVHKETSTTIESKNDVERKRRSERKSRCVSTSKRVHERNRDDLRYNKRRHHMQPEQKKVTLGGLNAGGNNQKSNNVTALIDGASKCTSVSGLAKTMAPKLAQGILGNKRMKKAWGSTSKKCSCCKCCSKCGSHCDTIVKIFMSVMSITIVAYDVAMAWTAFSGFYRFEGSSPLTIVFGIVCSIASILMLFEVRNAIMTCLVSVIKVKRLQKTGEGSSFRQKVINEEYWQETVQLLELFLGDLPIAIILALTITFASCGLYNATFKKGIVGKLALYAVFISAAWKAIMACVQFYLSKPFRQNEQGKRRYAWAVFRLLRPLLALIVLFFALYIILTINGVYINLTGKDEARLDCIDA